jgi:CheY-like chemotaxis protein
MASLQRVLYVEDEPDIQAVAKLALEMLGGLTVRLCSSGQEALDCAAGFAPDVLLLDVMMPGMDGPSTLREMRQRPDLASLPVIFMTAKVQPDEVASYKAMGALGVIAKPFDPMKLADEVRRLWTSREAR